MTSIPDNVSSVPQSAPPPSTATSNGAPSAARAAAPPAPPAAAQAVEILCLACWFAVALALVEVIGRWVLSEFFGKLPLGLIHPQVAWMTLASELLFYGVVGGVLALLAVWTGGVPLWLAVAIYAALFFYGLGDVLAVPQWYAAAALALGLASAAARSTARLQVLAKRTLWPLAALAVLLSAGSYGWCALREYRATAALPPPANTPNLLFITLDTVRADRLHLYGYGRQTSPRLEEYAKRGVVFDQAISTVSWTLPSHASMFTGHFPPDVFHDTPPDFTGDWKIPMDDKLPTLAEYLDQHGYRTGGFAANWTYCDRLYGLGRGFTHYVEYNPGIGQMLNSSFLMRAVVSWLGERQDPRFVLGRKDGLTVNSEFLHWLDGVKGRPFFAFLNYMDAHDPYNPPPAFADLFGASERPLHPVIKKSKNTWDMEKLNPDDYDCSLAALDAYVGRLLDELDRRGLLGNTLVVIAGDHGEHFGEHSYFAHGDTLYMPVLHVPLLVLFPGHVPAGKRVPGPTSLRDLAATMIDVLGLTEGSPFPGTSLRSRWDERHAPARPAFSYLDLWFTAITNESVKTFPVRLRSVVDEHYQYIEGVGEGFRALFDLKRDPLGDNDLSGADGQEPVMQRYHALVAHGPS